jgi:hypothetical protein
MGESMNNVINYVKVYPVNDYMHLESSAKENALKLKPNPVQSVKASVENGSLKIDILV